jgi:hypothetical protein
LVFFRNFQQIKEGKEAARPPKRSKKIKILGPSRDSNAGPLTNWVHI